MKKPLKNIQNESPITVGRCEFISAGNLTIPPLTIGDTPKKSYKENCTRILHDLKKIAIAINELCRDLDRIQRDNTDSLSNSV